MSMAEHYELHDQTAMLTLNYLVLYAQTTQTSKLHQTIRWMQ